MKTTVRLSAALLLFLAVSPAQDHAPTVDQCRADQRLWSSQLDTPEEVNALSFRKLNKRSEEMAACSTVDEEHPTSYSLTGARLTLQKESRLFDFVTRHKLFDQFLAEDAAGKR
jgi:hypothetical protein